jgi:hypothetical protein
MAVARYRPDHDVTFDLAHGLVHLDGAPARVLVPADALAALCAAADAGAVTAFGHALGHAMGLRVASRLALLAVPESAAQAGSGARAASVETMVDHLGAELSLAGLGSLGMERWGHALVVVVDHCPLGARGDRLLEAVIGEAVGSATARAVAAILLARDGVRARLLLANTTSAGRVRAWLDEGVAWGDAITRLHAPPAPPQAS